MKYWQTQEFLALQKAWYERLNNIGFKDVESKLDGFDPILKELSDKVHRYRYRSKMENHAEYFRVMLDKACQSVYDSEIDKIILNMFADGKRYKDIYDFLASQGNRRCLNTLRFTVRKYEVRWGVKEYSPRELNKREPK